MSMPNELLSYTTQLQRQNACCYKKPWLPPWYTPHHAALTRKKKNMWRTRVKKSVCYFCPRWQTRTKTGRDEPKRPQHENVCFTMLYLILFAHTHTHTRTNTNSIIHREKKMPTFHAIMMTPLQGKTNVACCVSGKLFSMIGVANLNNWPKNKNNNTRNTTRHRPTPTLVSCPLTCEPSKQNAWASEADSNGGGGMAPREPVRAHVCTHSHPTVAMHK